MSFRGKFWVLVISGVISVYAVVGGLPLVGNLLTTQAQQSVNDPVAQQRILESVLNHIKNDYVDTPDMEKVRLGALRGLCGGLDPYSSFLTAEQVQTFQNGALTNKVGIGAEFSQISGYLYVISAIKGGPADKAGIKAGDVIEYIDGKATRDISLYDARLLIKGDAGTPVSLRVLRTREKPQTIKVVRGAHKVPAAESRIEAGKVGVVKVHSLEDGEANDIRTQVTNLTRQGVQKIVLDLRAVAAGKLTEGVAVANLFIHEGELARVIGRENKIINSYAADPAKAIFDGSLVVLIDISTAGAAEAVASAVLEHKRGEVVGEKSFGAGTEQKLFPLKGGDGCYLTVAKWASPAGSPFLGDDRATTGVKPSIEVKRPDTPEPVEVETLIDEQTDEPEPQTQPTPQAKPTPKVVEDLQMKKALELLQDKAVGAKSGE